MKYEITDWNYLYKGEIVKSDDNECFVLYDINGKKHYQDTYVREKEFDTLEEAIEYQRRKNTLLDKKRNAYKLLTDFSIYLTHACYDTHYISKEEYDKAYRLIQLLERQIYKWQSIDL